MILLTRDFVTYDTERTSPYPSNTYPYQEVGNTFGPLQPYEDALKQACVKRLSTQSGVEAAYTDDYGMDWIEIHNKPKGWIICNLPRMIEQCLTRDDRVKGVSVEIVSVEADTIAINVTINNEINTGIIEV